MGLRCHAALPHPLPTLPGRIALVIPAYNEAQHLPRLLAACGEVRPALIVVVDDCSTDGTAEVLARELAAARLPLRVLRNTRNLGKQGSVARALRELLPVDLDGVALLDGDGQHDPRELPGLAALLVDHDLVVGARSHARMPPQRRLSNWLVNRGFELLGGVGFVDVQSGLRLYRKALADVLARTLRPDGGYSLEHESLAILAAYASERGLELQAAAAPISCAYGEARSKMRAGHVLQLAAETVRQALRLRRAMRGALTTALPRALTVEIHDITPAWRDEVQAIGAALAAVGVERPTLLVVPRFVDEAGRCWDLRDDPALIAWLRAQQRAGAEIVQHGLTHRAPAPPPPGLGNALMHRWFSRGCAEFAHLSGEEAASRLLAGRRILRECGLEPGGFIAPAWQQSPAAIGVLARLGFAFTAFLDHLLPLGDDPRPVRTPALTFAAPNAVVDHAKRVVMRGVEACSRPAPLLRVAVHPEDLHGARPVEHILERVQRLLRHRRHVTYAEWLAERHERERHERAAA